MRVETQGLDPDAQAFTLPVKTKRRRVMHDTNLSAVHHTPMSLLNVSCQDTPNGDLRIGEEPIQRFPIGHRRHLLREALARRERSQRHDAFQSALGVSNDEPE